MTVKSILKQASPSGVRGKSEASRGMPNNTCEGTCRTSKENQHWRVSSH